MQKENVITYFNQPLEKYESLTQDFLRPELYDILQQAKLIQRFEGLGLSLESIQGETVKTHTLRLMFGIDELPISEEIKNSCRKTLVIHDLPEVKKLIETNKTADTTAPEKALRVDLDEEIEKSEKKIALKIFNDKELKLYLDFSNANNFLKNRRQKPPTTVGLICKFLDKIDGDLHYHTAAIASRDNWKELNAKGQNLAFEQYISFSQKLDLLKDTKLSDTTILCQNLLNSTMLTIQEMWNEVPPNEIPPIIKKCSDNFKIHTNKNPLR